MSQIKSGSNQFPLLRLRLAATRTHLVLRTTSTIHYPSPAHNKPPPCQNTKLLNANPNPQPLDPSRHCKPQPQHISPLLLAAVVIFSSLPPFCIEHWPRNPGSRAAAEGCGISHAHRALPIPAINRSSIRLSINASNRNKQFPNHQPVAILGDCPHITMQPRTFFLLLPLLACALGGYVETKGSCLNQ